MAANLKMESGWFLNGNSSTEAKGRQVSRLASSGPFSLAVWLYQQPLGTEGSKSKTKWSFDL